MGVDGVVWGVDVGVVVVFGVGAVVVVVDVQVFGVGTFVVVDVECVVVVCGGDIVVVDAGVGFMVLVFFCCRYRVCYYI